jgi:hypothetical protein
MAMEHGPADWYVIGSGVVAVIGLGAAILWAASDPHAWSSWRASMRRLPPPDPRYRGQPAERVRSRKSNAESDEAVRP